MFILFETKILNRKIVYDLFSVLIKYLTCPTIYGFNKRIIETCVK